jgi:hypothetical protein
VADLGFELLQANDFLLIFRWPNDRKRGLVHEMEESL